MEIPGFIDLQINGYKGVDFSDPALSKESFDTACRGILNNGTLAFLPTIITSSSDTYERNLPLLSQWIGEDQWEGRLIGIHAEGPYMSNKPGAVGAHNPDWMEPPSIESFKKMQSLANGKIKLLTIAADAEGADQLCKYASSNGVFVSLGHHLANSNELENLAQNGALGLTHLGNGLPNEVHRHNNPLIAGIANEKLVGMVITDGHHIPDDIIKIVYKTKGIEKFVIVSDASSLAGMPPGEYQGMGNKVVIEENGLLHNPEKKCLVGSSFTMLECMNYVAGKSILSLNEMIQASIGTPLNLLNIKQDDLPTKNRVYYDSNIKQFKIMET